MPMEPHFLIQVDVAHRVIVVPHIPTPEFCLGNFISNLLVFFKNPCTMK